MLGAWVLIEVSFVGVGTFRVLHPRCLWLSLHVEVVLLRDHISLVTVGRQLAQIIRLRDSRCLHLVQARSI